MKKVLQKSLLLIAFSVFLFPNSQVYGTTAEIEVEFQNIIRTDVNTLFYELSENIVRFDQRYRNQVIELTGRVSASGVGEMVNPYTNRREFYFTLRGDGLTPYTIRIFFPAANANQLERIGREQDVVVRGQFIRFVDGSNPIGNHLAGNAPILTNSSVIVFGTTREQRETIAEQERHREQQAREAARQAEQIRIVNEINALPEGVVINGVLWATRNVGTSGTFVSRVEDVGGAFTWEQAQNACPSGWRVPTSEELESFRSIGKSITLNGVRGQLFGTEPNQIFLPAITYISFGNSRTGIRYWSSTRRSNDNEAWHLSGSSNGSVDSERINNSLSVRCVTDATTLTEIPQLAEQARIQQAEQIRNQQLIQAQRLTAEEELHRQKIEQEERRRQGEKLVQRGRTWLIIGAVIAAVLGLM
ncbi:MAG: DUF1566 domain-containing protein [Dysgonamonadaceae bacterium]|nr:DUF1566 domain-containing protein [Dysgonamonadaceae bacterium]